MARPGLVLSRDSARRRKCGRPEEEKKEGQGEKLSFRDSSQKLPQSTATLSLWPDVVAGEVGCIVADTCPWTPSLWGVVHPKQPSCRVPTWFFVTAASQENLLFL